MLEYYKSLTTRDFRLSPGIGFESALEGVRVTDAKPLNEQRIDRN